MIGRPAYLQDVYHQRGAGVQIGRTSDVYHQAVCIPLNRVSSYSPGEEAADSSRPACCLLILRYRFTGPVCKSA
jgi:hypothetical protein